MATPANRLDQYRAQRLAEEEALLRAAPPEAFRQPPAPPTLGYDFLEPPVAPSPRLDRDIVPSASTTGTIGDLVEGPSFAVNRPSARPSAEVRAEQRRLAEAEALVPPIQQGVGAALLSKLFGRPVGLGAGAAVAARQAAVRQTARKLGTEEQKLTLERIKAVQEQQKELRDRAKFFQDTLAFAIKTFGNDAAAGAAHLQDVATNLGLQVPPEVLQGYYRLAAGRPETIGQLSLAIAKGTLPTTFATENVELVKAVRAQAPGYGETAARIIDARFGPGASRNPTQEMLAFADQEIQRRQVEVSAATGAAGVTARGEAQKDLPLSPEEAARLGVPYGTTGRQAEAMGIVPKTAAREALQISGAASLRIVDRLEDLLARIPLPATTIGRLADVPSAFSAVALQNNPDAVLFQTLAEGTLANIVRTFGERGTLTDQDIRRARSLMPVIYPVPDTREVATRKLAQLRALIQELEGRPASGPGGSPAPAPRTVERRELNGRIYERRNGQWFDVTPEGR